MEKNIFTNYGKEKFMWQFLINKRQLRISLILFLIIYVQVGATVYYVSPDGNDANPGTLDQPWLTPHYAALTAGAGDTVYFQPGTYHISEKIQIMNSGTEDAWITFSAAPGHMREAIIDGGVQYDGYYGAWYSEGASYIKIIGFTVQNVQPYGAGFWMLGRKDEAGTGSATGLRIQNCKISNTYDAGIIVNGVAFKLDGTLGNPNYIIYDDIIIEDCEITKTHEGKVTDKNECISVGEELANVIIRNNYIHDSKQFGIDVKEGNDGVEVYGNYIKNIEKHGIYIDAIGKWDKNIKVYNNFIENAGNAGICLAREKNGATSTLLNIEVFNNVVSTSGREGFMLYNHVKDVGGGVLDSIYVYNNSFYNGRTRNGIRAVHPYISLATVYIYNNIVWKTASGTWEVNDEVVRFNNLEDQDPKFVNISSQDFHLLPGSPAIDAGAPSNDSTNSPIIDYDNVARPYGASIDIGAYEYHETTSDGENGNEEKLPHEFRMGNYPNPFNPTTIIRFEIPSLENNENVVLKIFDTLGRLVTTLADYNMSSGVHEIVFNGSNLSSGIYIACLQCKDRVLTHSAILLR